MQFYNIVTWKPFTMGVTLCIIGNIMLMLATMDDISD